MMKKRLIVIVLLLLFSITAAAADEFGFEQSNEYLPEGAERLEQEEDGWLSWFTLENVLNFALGGLVDVFRNSARSFAKILAVIVMLSVINMVSAEGKHGIATAFSLLCAVSISAIFYTQAAPLIENTLSDMNELSVYVKALLPAYTAALAATGNVTTSALLPATAFAAADLFITLMNRFLLPFVSFYFALLIAGAVSERVRSTGFAELIKRCVVWLLSILSTVLVSVLGIQKLITASADNVAGRAAKLAVSGMVPIVGSVVKDAYETVSASIKLICSANGAFALAVILYTLLPIFCSAFVNMLCCKFCAAFCETAVGKKSAAFISGISDIWTIIIAAAACEGIVFVFAIAVLISSGG